MTKVEKALHWAYRYERGERDFSGCPGDHDIGDTKVVVDHLLALSKEVEVLRKKCAHLADCIGASASELATLRLAAKELCDEASEAREFFGDDVDDAEAYAAAHYLREAEKAVRAELGDEQAAEVAP